MLMLLMVGLSSSCHLRDRTLRIYKNRLTYAQTYLFKVIYFMHWQKSVTVASEVSMVANGAD